MLFGSLARATSVLVDPSKSLHLTIALGRMSSIAMQLPLDMKLTKSLKPTNITVINKMTGEDSSQRCLLHNIHNLQTKAKIDRNVLKVESNIASSRTVLKLTDRFEIISSLR